MEKQYYLRMEGVNLSNFVYDTDKIQPMRGGGYLILDCALQLATEKPSGIALNIIMTGASIGLFSFEVSEESEEDIKKAAEGVAEAVRKFLHNQTKGHATFVVDIIPFSIEADFIKDTEALTSMNRWQQFQQPTLLLPAVPTEPSGNPCAYDSVRPGNKDKDNILPDNEGYLSDSVAFRKKQGGDLRKSIYEKILNANESENTMHGASAELPSNYEKILGKGANFTDDLDELSKNPDMGNLNGKIALIYLDGNKFGRIRHETCTSPEKLLEFDKTLKNLGKGFLSELLTKAKTDESFNTIDTKIRLELLLWGGDEYEFVVPAWKGLEVLSLFYEKTKLANFSGYDLTYGGGIVFCNHKTPIREARKTVRGLEEMAKDKLSSDLAGIKHDTHDVCHYLVLESFEVVGQDVSGFANRYYGSRFNNLLIGRDMIGKITTTVTLMKKNKFPRTKIFEIIHALLGRADNTVIEALLKRALENTVDPTEVRTQIDAMISDNADRWFLVADLWDYVREVKQ